MMQQVNLLSDDMRPQRELLTVRQLLLVWAGLAAVLILVSGWRGLDLWQLQAEQADKLAQVEVLQRINTQLRAAINTEPDPVLEAEVENLRQLQANQELLVLAVQGYQDSREGGFSPYFDDLARHHVRGMWLSRISLEDGGSRIRLSGETVDPIHVPEFLQQLSQGESFKGHRFDGLELEEQESGLLRFEISGPAEARSG